LLKAMRALSNTTYDQLVHFNAESCGFGRWKVPPGRGRVFRNTVHYLSHKFILNRRGTRSVRATGFRLAVYPTVFHPKLFLTSEFFARFLATINLAGKRVADVGTASGILAAARAGATISAAEALAPPYWANGRYEPGKSRTPGHPAAIGAN
jgi:release factor glutamine methyltransferase